MSEEKSVRKNMDPEALARGTLDHIASLQEVFCCSLEGKVALVTGGSSGLGYNVVNRLCEAGARVVIASRNEIRGNRAVADFREKGYEVSFVQTDVKSVEACYHAVDVAVEKYGSLDILVANASGWSNRAYLDVSEDLFDDIMQTDLKGAYFIGQAAARYMVAHQVKGKIVFVSSAAHMGEGPGGLVMNTYYIAAKAAVTAMTKGIAGELKQYGIVVNCVAPGGMLSAGVITQGSDAPALYGEEYLKVRQTHSKDSPVAMNPDMVALAVYAMCTPMADFMAGEVVNVNGGAMMRVQEKPFSYTVEGCIPGPETKK